MVTEKYINPFTEFNRDQLLQYEDSLKYYRDLNNSFATAREDAMAQGLAQGLVQGLEQGKTQEKLALASKMKAKGYEVAEIMALTGLDEQSIEAI